LLRQFQFFTSFSLVSGLSQKEMNIFWGNQLQRFTQLHLGLYASSPRKAAGYFAAIPVLVCFIA
jgi:hypothetical protein